MPTLVDQFGRPVASQKRPERRPLAAAPILDSYREYIASGLTPEKLARLLKEADAGEVGRQAELFDQLEERDGHLIGEIGKRKNVILDVDFDLTPASEESRDKEVRDFVEKTLDNLTDWPDVLVSLQDGVGKGFSCLEVHWGFDGKRVVPENFTFIEQHRFRFTDRKGILSRTPLLITDADPLGIEIPAWKVLFHKYGGKSGHPTRSGILRVCAWMHLFKNYSIKDWVIFLEVFGMPLRLGKYPTGATEADKDALLRAITTIGTDAAGIISESTKIEFIEAVKGSITGSPYREMIDFCNREMSKAILGQTLTAEVKEGSYAAAQTHNEVRLDLMRADGRAIAATIRDQLIRPLVGFNYGWDAALPFYSADFEEPEDQEKKARIVYELVDRGLKVSESWAREEFGIAEPEGGEPVLRPKTGKSADTEETVAKLIAKLDLSKSGEPDAADKLFAAALPLAGRTTADLIAPIRALVDKAESLDEIRAGLDALGLSLSEIEDLLARAMTAGNLTGRSEVADGR